jgi:hypothetical protein
LNEVRDLSTGKPRARDARHRSIWHAAAER